MSTNRNPWPIETKSGWAIAIIVAAAGVFSSGGNVLWFIFYVLSFMAVMMALEWAWRSDQWLPSILAAAFLFWFFIDELLHGGWWALLWAPLYALLSGVFLGRGLKNLARS